MPDQVSNKCPDCGRPLRFDSALLLWRCTNPKCKRIYTFAELRKAQTTEVFRQKSLSSYPQRATAESTYNKSRRGLSAGKIIGILFAITLIVSTVLTFIGVFPFLGPAIFVDPLSFSFDDEEPNPPVQTLTVENSGHGELIWSVTDNADWLVLNPTSGSIGRGEVNTIDLSVDIPSGMKPGIHTTTITISAPRVRNTPPEVMVSLAVSKERQSIRAAVGGNVKIYYDEQPPYSKGQALVNLTNSNCAVDPTWQELLQFIGSDDTETGSYLKGFYMCGSFAEKLHNNAEQKGIRSAWVVIHFTDGSETHALNAFYTKDRGVVFVDCTGRPLTPIVAIAQPPRATISDDQKTATTPIPKPAVSYDKIAYVREGRECGLVSLNVARSPEYKFYEEYKHKLEDYEVLVKGYNPRAEDYSARVEDYNQKVSQYTEQISGKVYYEGSAEYIRILGIYNALNKEFEGLEKEFEGLEHEREELQQLQQELGWSWKPFGVVSEIEVYW